MRLCASLAAGSLLVLTELDRPVPDPGWVVVKVESAGLCRSDLHIASDKEFTSRDRQIVAPPPRTLGHEIAGTVFAPGHYVTGWEVGDAVVVDPIPPGTSAGSPGNTIDCGFAE